MLEERLASASNIPPRPQYPEVSTQLMREFKGIISITTEENYVGRTGTNIKIKYIKRQGAQKLKGKQRKKI